MKESITTPVQIRQPLEVPVLTGDVTRDKANMWIYRASWEAARAVREDSYRAAEEQGLPRPDLSSQPDISDEHSRLLTTLSTGLENEGTRAMLATFQEVNENNRLYRGIDVLPDQMAMLQAVLDNPDVSQLIS